MALTRPKKKSKPTDNGTEAGKNKTNLTASDRVKTKNQVSRDDIVPEMQRVTFPVNIRGDNHIRNELSALLNLGIEKNMKGLLNHLIQSEKLSLDESQESRFEKMVNILEQKDYMSKNMDK